MVITFDFGNMNVLFLLITQQRMEEGIHKIGMSNLVGWIEQRHEEVSDFRQTSLGDGFNVRSTHVNAAWKTVDTNFVNGKSLTK